MQQRKLNHYHYGLQIALILFQISAVHSSSGSDFISVVLFFFFLYFLCFLSFFYSLFRRLFVWWLVLCTYMCTYTLYVRTLVYIWIVFSWTWTKNAHIWWWCDGTKMQQSRTVVVGKKAINKIIYFCCVVHVQYTSTVHWM